MDRKLKNGPIIPGVNKADAAMEYSRSGLICYPAAAPRLNDKHSGKAPLINGWSSLKSPMTDAEIKNTFKNRPNLNIGMLCGGQSNRTVIDMDSMLFWPYLQNGIDDSNFIWVKRDGADRGHIHFRYTNAFPASKHHAIGIEVLNCNKNNAILPPSMHYSGTQYKWCLGQIPNSNEIPEMPELFKRRLKKLLKINTEIKSLKGKIRPCFTNFLNEPQVLHSADGRRFMLALAAELLANGASNGALHMVVKIVYKNHYDRVRTETELQNVNGKRPWKCGTLGGEFGEHCNCSSCNQRGQSTSNIQRQMSVETHASDVLIAENDKVRLRVEYPNRGTLSYVAYDSVEMPQAVKSRDVYRADSNTRTKMLIGHVVLASGGAINKTDAKKIITQLGFNIATQEIQRPMPHPMEAIDFNKYFDGNTFISKRLADELMAGYVFLTPMDPKANPARVPIYVYEDGRYVRGAEAKILSEAQTRLGESATTLRLNEILRHIRIETTTDADPFNHSIDIINVRNGLLEWKTGELRPHTPNHLSTIQINARWNVTASCPKINAFLNDVIEALDRPSLEEFTGYSMTPDISEQKIEWFYNPEGGGGKSTWIEVLRNFYGSDNVSGESLQQLENDQYSVANLRGKLVNLFPDLSAKAIQNNEIIKQIATDSHLRGVEKFMTADQFRNTVHIVVASNKPPEVPEDSAFFDRLLMIRFPNKIRGTSDEIKGYSTELSTPAELDGLLKLAVDGLRRLKKNDGFTNSTSPEEVQKKFEINASSGKAFIKYKMMPYSHKTMRKDLMWDAYVEWCAGYDVMPLSQNKFSRLMSKSGFEDQRESSGNRGYVWLNAEIRKESNTTENQPSNIGKNTKIEDKSWTNEKRHHSPQKNSIRPRFNQNCSNASNIKKPDEKCEKHSFDISSNSEKPPGLGRMVTKTQPCEPSNFSQYENNSGQFMGGIQKTFEEIKQEILKPCIRARCPRLLHLCDEIRVKFSDMSDATLNQETAEKIETELKSFIIKCRYQGNPCYHGYNPTPIIKIGSGVGT